MTLPIVQYNSPILRKKGVKITTFDAALARLAADMIDTMHAAAGIGLAAQQIGQAIPLCVVDLRQTESEFQWELDGARPPLESVRQALKCFPGVVMVDDREANHFPMPIEASGRDEVLVGRLRYDLANDHAIELFLSGDQILKGAALNGIQIAETWIKMSN